MKYLKRYENYEPKQEIEWTIKISSEATLQDDVSNEKLEKALNSLTNPYHVNWQKEHNDSVAAEYAGTQAEWQIAKSNEIEQSFIDNLEIKFSTNWVRVNSEYKVGFPDDWSRGDVVDWATTIHDINKAYIFSFTEELASGENPDRAEHNKIMEIFKTLLKNNKMEVSNNNESWFYDKAKYDWVKK